MSIGEVFATSWKIFWKNKILWVFGIAPLVFYLIPYLASFLFIPGPTFFTPNDYSEFNIYGELLVAGIYLVFLVVYAIATVLAASSIVRGIYLADQRTEKLTLNKLVREGRFYFWKVFGLYAIFIGAILLVVVVLWMCMFLAVFASMGFGLLCMFPLFLFLSPLIMLGSALLEISKAAAVINGLGIQDALKQAWALFRLKFWNIVLVAIILNVGMYIISFILFSPVYFIMFVPMWMQMSQESVQVQTPASSMFTWMRWVYIIIMPIYMIIQGILLTFLRTVWAVTYLRLAPTSSPDHPLVPAVAEPG
jgi:hypothetical protein